MKDLLLCFFTLLTITFPAASPAAPPGLLPQLVIPTDQQIQILTTRDGSVRIGQILGLSDKSVRFGTRIDETFIPYEEIKSIRTVPRSSMRKGEYWAENSNSTRLFFGPTGRMLKKGQGYFADHYIFFPTVVVGITDNVTMGGGMSVFPGVGPSNQIFSFTPKIGVKAGEDLHLAAGALMMRWSWEGDPESVGIFYGVATYGSPDGSLTVGMGYGYENGNLAERPMVMIGGEKRLSRRTAFVTENWLIPGADQPLISYGVRFIGEQITVDFALLNTIGEGASLPGVPYIDFVIGF